jgi:3-methyladenine DNA glycosylase AlkD
MTAKEIVEELRMLGAESIKKVLRNHGMQQPFFGVKISDMKKIQKRIKKDYQLALDLYDTSAAGFRSLCHERLLDRIGHVRARTQRPRCAGSGEGWPGFGRHG